MISESQFTSYKYIYPPRPEVNSPKSILPTLERMGMWAQPKLNGSCATVSINEDGEVVVMNRHKQSFAKLLLDTTELAKLHRGKGWMVLVGEYMNKSKSGTDGVFNAKFVIFDILVYNGTYMTGSTFQSRQELLDSLYSTTAHDTWIDRVAGVENVYRARNFFSDFKNIWEAIVKIDMYEGFVFKRPAAILEAAYNEKNNTKWQVKVRKETKNYSY